MTFYQFKIFLVMMLTVMPVTSVCLIPLFRKLTIGKILKYMGLHVVICCLVGIFFTLQFVPEEMSNIQYKTVVYTYEKNKLISVDTTYK